MYGVTRREQGKRAGWRLAGCLPAGRLTHEHRWQRLSVRNAAPRAAVSPHLALALQTAIPAPLAFLWTVPRPGPSPQVAAKALANPPRVLGPPVVFPAAGSASSAQLPSTCNHRRCHVARGAPASAWRPPMRCAAKSTPRRSGSSPSGPTERRPAPGPTITGACVSRRACRAPPAAAAPAAGACMRASAGACARAPPSLTAAYSNAQACSTTPMSASTSGATPCPARSSSRWQPPPPRAPRRAGRRL